MKTNRIISFFRNIISLIKTIITYNNIDWRSLISEEWNSSVDDKVVIKHPYHFNNVKVGYGTYLARNSFVSFTEIGRFCSIGPNFLCGWGIHPTNGVSTSPSFYSTTPPNGIRLSIVNKIEEHKQITIGSDVFIGSNVTVLDGITIGDGAVIGAGAVVSKDIPPYAIAVGCPIKVIKYRFSEEQIISLLKIRWWNNNSEGLKKVEKNQFDIDQFIQDNSSS